MIAPLLMFVIVFAPHDPPPPQYLTPIPIVNADLSSDRNLFLTEHLQVATPWVLTSLAESDRASIRTRPLPDRGAPTVEATIEVARERELRDERFLAIEPGATAIMLLETDDALLPVEPGARYECSWAEGTTEGNEPPRLELSLRSATTQQPLGSAAISPRDPHGLWKRTRAHLQVDSRGRTAEEGMLLCLHNPKDADSPLFIDNLTLARIQEDPPEFQVLFNGRDLTGWAGSEGTLEDAFVVRDGVIECNPNAQHGNNLLTEEAFADFILHLEFKLPPAGNNGIALRSPLVGDPAYEGFEAQVLDTINPVYMNIKPWQTHGSIYGVAPSKRGFQRPTGDWNQQSIHVEGRQVVVVLNGETILDVDLDAAVEHGTLSGQDHPGLLRTEGHVGFCGHGDPVSFRNIPIQPLETPTQPSPEPDRTRQ